VTTPQQSHNLMMAPESFPRWASLTTCEKRGNTATASLPCVAATRSTSCCSSLASSTCFRLQLNSVSVSTAMPDQIAPASPLPLLKHRSTTPPLNIQTELCAQGT
jgi:hypothetical protein